MLQYKQAIFSYHISGTPVYVILGTSNFGYSSYHAREHTAQTTKYFILLAQLKVSSL